MALLRDPLAKISTELHNFSKYGGFPLDRCLDFPPGQLKFALVYVVALVLVSSLDLVIPWTYDDFHIDHIKKLGESVGFKMQDMTFLTALDGVSVIYVVLMFFASKKKGQELKAFFRNLPLMSNWEEAARKTREIGKRWVVVSLVTSVFQGLPYVAMMHLLYAENGFGRAIYIGQTFTKPLHHLLMTANPIVMGGLLLAVYVVFTLSEAFQKLPSVTEGGENHRVEVGLALCRCVGLLNECTWPLLLLAPVVYIAQTCVVFYSAVGMVADRVATQAPPDAHDLMLSAFVGGFIGKAAVNCYLMFALYSAGQALETARDEAKCRLEEMSHFDDQASDAAIRLGLLLKRLTLPAGCSSSSSSSVSPRCFFGLNHSGLLSAGATAVTYIIVLLQFRQT